MCLVEQAPVASEGLVAGPELAQEPATLLDRGIG
jgi:hypothetical protein